MYQFSLQEELVGWKSWSCSDLVRDQSQGMDPIQQMLYVGVTT